MKVVLVTGSSSGIGKATALELARSGYKVYASMLPTEIKTSELLEISAGDNLNLRVLALDVTDPRSCKEALGEVIQEAEGIDILINNAGIGEGGPLEEVPEDVLRRVFEVNYFGPMRLMRQVIPQMRERNRGVIVNLTSVMGRLARPGASAYAGSKFALEAASESLAQEVHRFNIRVIIIEPGVVLTPLHTRKKEPLPDREFSPYDEFTARGERLFGALLRKPTLPEEVAAVIRTAIETDQPRLRYVIGEDAEKWIQGRQRLSDEEWVNLGRKMDLDEYAEFYREKFGMMI